jgi:hypothetical protein
MGSAGAISNRNDRHEIEDTHSYRIRRIKLPFPGKFGSITVFYGRAFRVKKNPNESTRLALQSTSRVPGSHQLSRAVSQLRAFSARSCERGTPL